MPTDVRSLEVIRLKRAYDRPAADDGYRVLIDRLWPRGRKREELSIDAWLKDLAPSNELRKWFNHAPARWDGFQERYREELEPRREALRELARRAEAVTVTLVFGAKDVEHSNAAALKAILEEL
jgi:uncharacterized protein YeaO (DUF488 family)